VKGFGGGGELREATKDFRVILGGERGGESRIGSSASWGTRVASVGKVPERTAKQR